MMRRILLILSIFLLLLNGFGAIYGGWLLMKDPSGEMIRYPLSYLEHTPFHTYLLPGLILFVCNGLLSLVIAVIVFLGWKRFPLLIMLQGFILGGWIIIEVLMIRLWYAPLHLTFLLIGALLVLAGTLLWRKFSE